MQGKCEVVVVVVVVVVVFVFCFVLFCFFLGAAELSFLHPKSSLRPKPTYWQSSAKWRSLYTRSLVNKRHMASLPVRTQRAWLCAPASSEKRQTIEI